MSICFHDWTSVDLFALSDKVNKARFEFWQPDALSWKKKKKKKKKKKIETSIIWDMLLVLIYDLPPFSLTCRVLRNIEGNQA